MVAPQTDDRGVEAVTARLEGLHIEGHGNHVCINLSLSGNTDTPTPTSVHTASTPAPKAQAKARPSRKGKRFYVIVKSKEDPSLKGIWEAEWWALEAKFPGGRMPGSGCWPCKGFDSLEAATKLWTVHLPEETPIHHTL